MLTRTVLIVDDDASIRTLVSRALASEGWTVAEAADGLQAIERAKATQVDLVVLDVNMPGAGGFDVLRELRHLASVNGSPPVPVILLTGRGEEDDRIRGLDLGADDYVTKPFSPGELAARVRSVMRRTERGGPTSTIEHGDLHIDLAAREVQLGGRRIDLTAREFDLLVFLAASPRQVFSRDQLLQQVWESSSAWQDEATVTEHVRRLRRKLEADPDKPRWLLTVRGVGYRFEP